MKIGSVVLYQTSTSPQLNVMAYILIVFSGYLLEYKILQTHKHTSPTYGNSILQTIPNFAYPTHYMREWAYATKHNEQKQLQNKKDKTQTKSFSLMNGTLLTNFHSLYNNTMMLPSFKTTNTTKITHTQWEKQQQRENRHLKQTKHVNAFTTSQANDQF